MGTAELQVTATELQVTLAPSIPPHRNLAIAARCENLNGLETWFPGSTRRLRSAGRDVLRPENRTLDALRLSEGREGWKLACSVRTAWMALNQCDS